MNSQPILFKKRMGITRALMICSAPLLLVIAPSWEETSFGHEIMEVGGHFLVAIGVLIRIYTSLYAGGRKNSVLLRDGPYSIVRNPLYVGSFFAVAGIGMQTASITLTVLAVSVFLILHHFTILKEEAFLGNHFGLAYARYRRSVPRWIPNFSKWTEAEEVLVKPRMVLLTMRDASLFIVAMIIVELLCHMRTADALPTWLIIA